MVLPFLGAGMQIFAGAIADVPLFKTSLSLVFNDVPAVFFTARFPASFFIEDACGKLLWELFQNTNIYSWC